MQKQIKQADQRKKKKKGGQKERKKKEGKKIESCYVNRKKNGIALKIIF